MATNRSDAPMAAVGSYDSVIPFQAIGIETTSVDAENRADVPRIINNYSRDRYAVVFVEEDLYAEFRSDIDTINENDELAVIPIPGQSGSLGIGAESIRHAAERAVGMDIFGVQ